ncbi:MAG: N-acetylmuramoyl-L-alanine amidase [Rhodospirillales bacterium]
MSRGERRPAAIVVAAAFTLILALSFISLLASSRGVAQAAIGAPPSLAACPGGPPAITVDVGHSVAEPGAISARGKPEFTFNAALAHAVAAALARAGAWPKLINEEGAKISLGERVELINRARPVLLLSIHHDSVQPQYLEAWTVDGRGLDYSDRFSGFSLFVSNRNRAAADSHRFAVALGTALLEEGLSPSLHHAEPIAGEGRPLLDARLGIYGYDGLAVLRGAAAPAVLLEAGIIKNRADEPTLETPQFRKKVADAVVAAVGVWCAGKGTPPDAPPEALHGTGTPPNAKGR